MVQKKPAAQQKPASCKRPAAGVIVIDDSPPAKKAKVSASTSADSKKAKVSASTPADSRVKVSASTPADSKSSSQLAEEAAAAAAPDAHGASSETDIKIVIEEMKKAAVGKSLDEKIQIYRQWADMNINRGRLDYAAMTTVMKELMTTGEMSALWSRLKTAMKGASGHVKQAWQSVCSSSTREGKVAEKNKVLAVQLAFGGEKDDHAWEDMLSEEFMSYTHKKGKKFKGEWMSERYMRKVYGDEEFEDMLKKGKLQKRKDAWGDDEFQKRIETEEEGWEHAHGGGMQFKGKLNDEDAKKRKAAFFKNMEGTTGEEDKLEVLPPDDPTEADKKNKNKDKDKTMTPEGRVDRSQRTLHAIIGSLNKTIALLKGKTLAKSIRDEMLVCLNKMSSLQKDMLGALAAENIHSAKASMFEKNAEKLSANAKNLVHLAKPHCS